MLAKLQWFVMGHGSNFFFFFMCGMGEIVCHELQKVK